MKIETHYIVFQEQKGKGLALSNFYFYFFLSFVFHFYKGYNIVVANKFSCDSLNLVYMRLPGNEGVVKFSFIFLNCSIKKISILVDTFFWSIDLAQMK